MRIASLSALIASTFALPAVAAIGSAHLVNAGDWYQKRQAPVGVLKRGERVATGLTLDVKSDGTVSNCVISMSSGYVVVDQHACDLYKSYARFSLSENSSAGMREKTEVLVWEGDASASDATESKARPAMRVDASSWVTTDDLPQGLLDAGDVVESNAALAISPEGKIINCSMPLHSEKPDLDRRACVLILTRGHYKPARDAKGLPTAGVDWMTIRWQSPVS